MGAASSTKEPNSEVLGRSTAPEGFVGRPCTPLRHRCPRLAEVPEKVMERGENECPEEQPGRPNTPPIVRSRQRPKASSESDKEADANATGTYHSSTPCVKSFAPISSEGIGHGLCFRIEHPGDHRPRDMGIGNPGDTHTTTSSRSTPSVPAVVGAYDERSKKSTKEEGNSSGKELSSSIYRPSDTRKEETKFTLDATEGPTSASEDQREEHTHGTIREKEGNKIMQRSIHSNNTAKNAADMVEDGSPSAYLMEAISRRDQVSASKVGATPKRITFDSRVETGVLVEERQKFHNAQGGGGGGYDENHAGFKFRTRPHVWMKPARISGWNRTYASVPTNSKSSGSTRSGGKSRGIPVHQHCANCLSATGTRPTNPGGTMSGKASTTTTRSETQHGMDQPTPTVLVPRAQAAHERSANEGAAARHPSMGASGTPTTGSSKINGKKPDEEVGSKVCGAAASTSTSTRTSTKPILEQFPRAHATLIEEMKQKIAHIQAEMEKQKEALAEAEQANDISSSAAKGENLEDRFSIVEIPQ